jgi:hypothetical protein
METCREIEELKKTVSETTLRTVRIALEIHLKSKRWIAQPHAQATVALQNTSEKKFV